MPTIGTWRPARSPASRFVDVGCEVEVFLKKEGSPEKRSRIVIVSAPPVSAAAAPQGPQGVRVALVKFSDPSRVSREISKREIKSRENAHDARDPSESVVLCVSSPRCQI